MRPDFVLPHGWLTDEVEKTLYQALWGIIDALTYVFGRDPSYWYRLHQSWAAFYRWHHRQRARRDSGSSSG